MSLCRGLNGVATKSKKARNNSGKTIRMKDKVLKINGKEYGFLTTYIANCAQLYARYIFTSN